MAAKTVAEYIEALPENVKLTLEAARRLILSAVPGIEEFMKWGVPTYGLSRTAPLFYLYGGKESVNLGFMLGASLEDPGGLLEGEGKKDSRHVQLSSPSDTENPAVKKLVEDSAKLSSSST